MSTPLGTLPNTRFERDCAGFLSTTPVTDDDSSAVTYRSPHPEDRVKTTDSLYLASAADAVRLDGRDIPSSG